MIGSACLLQFWEARLPGPSDPPLCLVCITMVGSQGQGQTDRQTNQAYHSKEKGEAKQKDTQKDKVEVGGELLVLHWPVAFCSPRQDVSRWLSVFLLLFSPLKSSNTVPR